jgi:gamma-glutamyl-gamma-aminobutyrate hydrolase PuuD
LAGPHWHPGGTSWTAYADAIERAGGEPVHLDAGTLGREGEVLDGLKGLVFSGGKDVDLRHYPNPPDLQGADPAAVMERYLMRPEPERDAYELALLKEGLARDLPILGICRGCQVLNVAVGGRLILDISLETGTPVGHNSHPPPDGASGRHGLRIMPGSLLAEILDPELFRECNSRHHQGVREEPEMPVRVAAVSPEDGLVEAIEVPEKRWAIGVQWHPEHADDHDVREKYAPLFRAFVLAAS